MAQPNFDYQGALDEGYSENEINEFLKQLPSSKQAPQQEKSFPSNIEQKKDTSQREGSLQNEVGSQNLFKNIKNFDYEGALKEGYSPEEINEFLSTYKPEKSTLEKAGRLGAQYALGAAEMAALPYEVATMGIGSTETQVARTRETIAEDVENLLMKKAYGEWSPEDEVELESLRELWKNPEKIAQEITHEPIDISIRGLTERASGLDLHPEGVLEKAASWMGFIKNPKNIKDLYKIGLTPKTLTKALLPEPTEAIRGLTAGAALQMAEEGQFGPVGTMAAAIAADIAGHGPKAIWNVIKEPKKSLAKAVNLFTGANSKQEWIREIVSDAEKAGVQLDAGTLTDSNLIRFAQARAAQSALSGDALDNFRKNLSGQIVKQYEAVADELGTLAFENNHQAAEAVRNFVNQEEKHLFREPYSKEELKGARPLAGRIATEERPDFNQEFLNRIAPEEFRNSYEAGETLKTVAEDIKAPLKEQFNHRWENLNRAVEEIPAGPQAGLARVLETFIEDQRGSLLLGESAAEHRVLQSARRLRDALVTEEGSLIGVTLRDLIKTKRTLGDVANWEFGGSNFQSAYKQIVGEIDRTIERSLREVNPQLREAYERLNAEYSTFKDVFENKNVMPLFEPKNENYNTIYNGFLKNPDKLRSLEDMMFASPRGQQVLNQVKRDYAQRAIESPGLSGRDLRNLSNVLGPQFEGPIQELITARQRAIEHPLPRAARQPALGVRVEIPTATAMKPVTGRGTPNADHAKRKLLEHIKGKTSDQIMKQMDTPEGIQKLRKALSLTEAGEDLFKKLARYKLHEMIDRNLMDNLQENVKLGKFSGLLKSSKAEAVVKELVGPDAFVQLRLLQKNAAILQASAEKFYNASKSGTSLIDAGLISTAFTGVFTGNPFMALPAIGKIGGMMVMARLIADPKFLHYLKEAALADNTGKFKKALLSMLPSINRAMAKAALEMQEER